MMRSAWKIASRVATSHRQRAALVSTRYMSMVEKMHDDVPQEVIDSLPDFPIETVDNKEYEYKTPVTSAHMIEGEKISTQDSVAISPEGAVVHGLYGPIAEPAASSIPLEFLALLRPAAQGAAALRVLEEKAGGKKGTVLVYGASMANGIAATQLADSAGHAVVGVVTSHHSGNENLMFSLKNIVSEPSMIVPEELAINKTIFQELVQGVSSGDEGCPVPEPDTFVEEFKELFAAYSEAYPDTRPAAVSEDELDFDYMEKEREFFELNMEAYLSQFPAGAPPVDKAKLDTLFNADQLGAFRKKFWKQSYEMICDDDKVGDLPEFSPPHIVHSQIASPEDAPVVPNSGVMPFLFSPLNKGFPEETDAPSGGPVIGAVICVTPELATAAAAVNKAGKSIRAKAEALAFLTSTERDAFKSARSVIQNAGSAPVVVIGGKIPGLETSVEPTDTDVTEALSALDIDDAGNTRLNFFVQSYRASDFPFYEHYAVHRANEVLSGPRQIIVLK